MTLKTYLCVPLFALIMIFGLNACGGGGGSGGGGAIPPGAPIANSATLASGLTGTAYSATVSASGGQGDLSWTIESGALPTGLNLTYMGNGRTATISGTPTAVGTAIFTLRVTDDAGQFDTQAYAISISAPIPALDITTTVLPAATESVSYSSGALNATGGEPPYTWSIDPSGDVLPAGMVINANTGEIVGTPQAASAGNYALVIRVTDSGNPARIDTASLNLGVTALNSPGQVTNLSAAYAAQVNKLTLNWTSPGGNGNTGTADEYDLRTSTTPITGANFSSATQIAIPAPQSFGNAESATVDLTWYSGTHYFALIARNTTPVAVDGALSNVLQVDMNVNSTLSLNTFNFGGHAVSSTTTQDFSITNNALYVDLSITSLSISGTGFSLVNPIPATPASVAPGSPDFSFTVDFTPTTTGSFSGTVSIGHNDPGQNQPLTIALSGTGAGSPASIVALSVSSPLVEAGTSVTLTADVFDNDSNLPTDNDIVSVTADLAPLGASANQAMTFAATVNADTGRYTFSVPTANVAAGDYTLVVRAQDSEGNRPVRNVTLTIVSPLQSPEVAYEYPAAASAGTTTFPANSRMVVVFSEAIDTTTQSLAYGTANTVVASVDNGTSNIAKAGSLSVVTGIDGMTNRIVVIDTTENLGVPGNTVILTLYAAKVDGSGNFGAGIRDTAGNRLNTGFGDSNIDRVGGNPAVGIRWASGAVDNTPPNVASREPAVASANNGPGTTVRVTFTEAMNPATFSSFSLALQGGGTITGKLRADIDTMQGLTFYPNAPLASGIYNVTLAGIQDLAGNALNATHNYSFTIADDTQAPQISLFTMNGLPAHLNGASVNGGSSPGGGKLLTHPNGFTVDAFFTDPGGSGIENDTASIELTNNRTVTGTPNINAGTNLVSAIGSSNIKITGNSIHLMIPSTLSFPTGDNTLSIRITDASGNQSIQSEYTFGVTTTGARPFNPALGTNDWKLYFGRDHETVGYNFPASTVTIGSPSTSANGDGDVDWDEDLEGMGFTDPTNPAELVNSGGGLTLNNAARNFLMNRLLFHMYRGFGVSVPTSDGNANPGFEALDTNPTATQGPDGVSIRFEIVASNPGTGFSRMAFGGFHDDSTLGRATVDKNNVLRSEDNGIAASRADTGIFSTNYVKKYWQTAPTPVGNQTYYYWDETMPFAAADRGLPVGASADDNFVLDPLQNPTGFTGTRLERYRKVARALDAYAKALAGTTVHEVGHSLGLIWDGPLGQGLYGNQSVAFPGSDNSHVDLESYFPGSGQNIMAPAAGIYNSISRYSRFNELAHAYMRNLCVVP